MHLVTGATGYVGPLLVERLLEQGREVRVLARDARRLERFAWHDRVEVVEGGVEDTQTLDAAVMGVDVAYYLVHAMSDGDDYSVVDRSLARGFAAACESAGVGRIIYLGGLYAAEVELTEHLASRREVGEVFLGSTVPAAVLQAGMVIGPGSASFELLRHAVETFPVLVGPSWLSHRVQPIAVEDLLHYLSAAGDLPPEVDRAFDIGGPDALRYRDLLAACARAAGRRPRPVVTFPVLLPHTTSLAIGTVAPGPTSLVSALVHSLSVEMVCDEQDLDDLVGPPPGGRTDVATALRAAFAA